MRTFPFRWILALLLLFCLAAVLPPRAYAQVGGVYIDTKGMMRDISELAPDDRLALLRQFATNLAPDTAVAKSSPLRKVSLKSLELEAARLHADGKPLPAEMRYLAGLSCVQYLFFVPETNDCIIAGPAEGWKQTENGDVVGIKSGRPVLQLDDLIAVLRACFPKDGVRGTIGCSIDPSPQGLARYNAFIKKHGGHFDHRIAAPVLAGMANAMGPQVVDIFGIDPHSSYAFKIVAADFRLKKLAMGHEPIPTPGLKNYMELAEQHFHGGPPQQHRWWFRSQFDVIQHTVDHTAYQFLGQGVEIVTAASLQDSHQKASPEAEALANSFTRKFEALSRQIPVFAELQNLIGLATVAEIVARRDSGVIGTERYKVSRGWHPQHFLDASACPTRTFLTPRTVPSLVSYRVVRNRHWLISVSGGIEIQPGDLANENLQPSKTPQLVERSRQMKTGKRPKRWWWD